MPSLYLSFSIYSPKYFDVSTFSHHLIQSDGEKKNLVFFSLDFKGLITLLGFIHLFHYYSLTAFQKITKNWAFLCFDFEFKFCSSKHWPSVKIRLITPVVHRCCYIHFSANCSLVLSNYLKTEVRGEKKDLPHYQKKAWLIWY